MPICEELNIPIVVSVCYLWIHHLEKPVAVDWLPSWLDQGKYFCTLLRDLSLNTSLYLAIFSPSIRADSNREWDLAQERNQAQTAPILSSAGSSHRNRETCTCRQVSYSAGWSTDWHGSYDWGTNLLIINILLSLCTDRCTSHTGKRQRTSSVPFI